MQQNTTHRAYLISIPVAASLAEVFAWRTAGFIVTGVENVSTIIGILIFGILYFRNCHGCGHVRTLYLFSLANREHRRSRIVGTALPAILVRLDGSGAVVSLITIPALLPLYERVGIDRRILARAVSTVAGAAILPWTGRMMRAAAVLQTAP